MCGLFGAIKCSDPAHSQMVADIVLALGKCSEERGTDSAGLAVSVADTLARKTTPPTDEQIKSEFATLDHTFIVKGTGKFSNLNLKPYQPVFLQGSIFIGHTRWATQGNAKDFANISPFYTDELIATHNGDINPKTVMYHNYIEKSTFGDTDSEVLFWSLDFAKNDRRQMTKVLRNMQGRAALAFFDRSQPDRMYLARAAVSPLCYTYDQYGNFYYASNPDWFRRIQKASRGVEFDDIILVPEGYLLTVSTLTGEVEDTRKFTPTAREIDVRMTSIAGYRGFTKEDKAVDMTLRRHKVAQPVLDNTWPAPTPAPIPSVDKAAASLGVNNGRAKPAAKKASESTYDSFSKSYYSDYEDNREDEFSSEIIDEYLLIDWDEVEDLCWESGNFDHYSFERILDAPEDKALKMIKELKADVAKKQEEKKASKKETKGNTQLKLIS